MQEKQNNLSSERIAIENLFDDVCPPVFELIKAKERLTEAFMWAEKALEHSLNNQ